MRARDPRRIPLMFMFNIQAALEPTGCPPMKVNRGALGRDEMRTKAKSCGYSTPKHKLRGMGVGEDKSLSPDRQCI